MCVRPADLKDQMETTVFTIFVYIYICICIYISISISIYICIYIIIYMHMNTYILNCIILSIIYIWAFLSHRGIPRTSQLSLRQVTTSTARQDLSKVAARRGSEAEELELS